MSDNSILLHSSAAHTSAASYANEESILTLQATYCCEKLSLDENKVNVNGGAIAMGHPLGATGPNAIPSVTLHDLLAFATGANASITIARQFMLRFVPSCWGKVLGIEQGPESFS